MNEQDAYHHHLMSHLIEAYTDLFRFIPCDETWESCKQHMKDFKESKFYVMDKSIYECIEDYVKNLGAILWA
jgi:hypothetical protein